MMTKVTGLLLHADGEPANGQAVISWIAFQIHNVVIVGGQKQVEIIDGQFTVDLYPNITAHPHGAYYTVRMELDNGAVYEEFWIVPDLPSATVEQVRSSFPLEPGMAINPMQIAGSGAEAGMIIAYNGSYWAPGWVSVENVNPNWIQLDVGSAGDDFWIDGSPVELGKIATFNIPSASLTARGLVTTGAQSFAGDKTFAGNVLVQGSITGPTVDDIYSQIGTKVPLTRQIIAGTGMGGGGSLAADVTLTADVITVNGQVGNVVIDPASIGGVPATRQVIAGAGLTGGGSLTADVTLLANVLSVNGQVGNVVITSSSLGVVPGHVIQDEGTPRENRAALNFVGDGVTVTDDPANNRSIVAITGGGTGSQTPWLTDIDANTWMLRNAGGIGVGASAFPLCPIAAGRTYVSVVGSTSIGTIELATQAADADALPIGQVAFTRGASTHGADKRVAVITVIGEGTTAGNRGAYMAFATHADGDAAFGALERMRITSWGGVGIGNTLATSPIGVSATTQLAVGGGTAAADITLGAPSQTLHPFLGRLNWANYSNSGTDKRVASIIGFGGAAADSGYLEFYTWNAGVPGLRIRIAESGNINFPGGFIVRPSDAGWEWWQGQFTHGTGEYQIIRRKTDGTAWFNNLTIRPDGSVGIGNQVGSAVPANALTVYESLPDVTGADASVPGALRRGLMVQAVMASFDGACIQMGSSGGVGWHIKQACYNGNEGPLTFYGITVASGNLQRVFQLYPGTATVFGNMNITGEYQVSGTNIKGAMQTPWITNINANNFNLDNCGILHLNIRAPDVGWDTHTRLWAQSGWGARFDSHQFAFDVSDGSSARMRAMSITISGTVTIPGRANIYALSDRAEGAGVWLDKAGAPSQVFMGLEQGSNFWRVYTPAYGNMLIVDYATASVGIATTPAHRLHVAGNLGVDGRALIVRASPTPDWGGANLEIQSSGGYGPRIAFHWSGLGLAQQFGMASDGTFTLYDNPGSGYAHFRAANIYAQGSLHAAGVLYTSAGIRNAAGYIHSDYFNMTADQIPSTSQASRIPVETNSDGYLRWGTPGNLNFYGSAAANHVHISRYMSWGGYSPIAGYCVFDASSGYMPNHTPQAPATCSRVDPTYPWTDTYPTLMAFANGATHGVRVDSARYAQLSPVNGGALIYNGQAADFSMTGVLTHYYNGGNAGLHIVGGAGNNAGLGLLRVSAQNVNATNLICCFERLAATFFQISAAGTIWMYFPTTGLKVLSVDAQGFVKAV